MPATRWKMPGSINRKARMNLPCWTLPPPWKTYLGYGVKAVEMELAALLVVAGMHGARAGGILTSDGKVVREPTTIELDYDPHREIVARGKARMLEITLDAMANLIEAEDNI
jgi:purine-nucleoside phosphorylase